MARRLEAECVLTSRSKTMENRKVQRAAWEPLRLVNVGHVAEVVQGGGGKISTQMAVDSGPESLQKPQGQG